MTVPRREVLETLLRSVLVEHRFITTQQLQKAEEECRATGKKLSAALVDLQFILPETVSTILSFQLNVPVVELRQFRVQPEALRLIPENVARERNVLAVSLEGDVLRVAMDDPQDLEVMDLLSKLTARLIQPVLPLRGSVAEFVSQAYEGAHLRDMYDVPP